MVCKVEPPCFPLRYEACISVINQAATCPWVSSNKRLRDAREYAKFKSCPVSVVICSEICLLCGFGLFCFIRLFVLVCGMACVQKHPHLALDLADAVVSLETVRLTFWYGGRNVDVLFSRPPLSSSSASSLTRYRRTLPASLLSFS
jgi:hypothetical protein